MSYLQGKLLFPFSYSSIFCSLFSQPCSLRDFFLFLIRFLFVRETEAITKESAACPITKASNSSHMHFHIPLRFVFSTFPAMQYQRFFTLFHTFSHLRNFKNEGYHMVFASICEHVSSAFIFASTSSEHFVNFSPAGISLY